MSVSDGDLDAALAAVRRDTGDDRAWQKIYCTFRRQVLGHLYLLGVQRADEREDLASEVFFRFVSYSPWSREWSTLPRAAIVAGYLRAITQNVAFDAARHRERANAAISGLTDVAVEIGAGRGAEALTEDEWRFLRHYVDCGYSLTRLAALLGTTYSAAGTRLHRIRKKLREAAAGL